MSEVIGKGLLDGVRAVVTGGGQGLGHSIAARFAACGATVAILDRDGPLAGQAAAALPGGGHLGLAADVTVAAEREEAVGEAIDRLGGLDVLVNNAGIQLHAPAEDITAEQWEKVLSVNLTAALMMSQLAARHLIARGSGGSIVNIGSLGSLLAMPRRTIYGTSKTAVLGLTRHLAVDWARHAIRVNAVCPGYHRTPLYEDYVRRGAIDEDRILNRIPMRRLGAPDDVADAAVFLASPLSSYLTGQALTVDGGYSVYGAAEDTPS